MTDCFAPWSEALTVCGDAVNDTLPTFPSPETDERRVKICANVKCQSLFALFRDLIADGCPGAVKEQKRFPRGMWTVDYCPTKEPPTLAPAPVTTPTTPSPSPSPSPVPTPTPLVTTVPAPPPPPPRPPTPPATTTITPVPAVTAPVVTTQAPQPQPQPLPIETDSGIITASAAGGGLFLLILAAVVIVLLVRRRRKRGEVIGGGRGNHVLTPKEDNAFDATYTNLSTAGTEAPTNTTAQLWGELALATNRIPLTAITLAKEPISHGGFGEVFRGTYKNQNVAVKRLLAARRNDPQNIKDFMAEIKLTSTLHHTNIAPFIGVAWDSPSQLCMVSEFISGGDLRSHLAANERRGYPSGYDGDKLRIAVQIAEALVYLHGLERPVVHRDLKSRNILLTSDLHAKLIDFGVSTANRDVTMTAGVGTSLWMAPEVLLGDRYNQKADIFSFGVLLSELDTQQLPYAHVTDTTRSSGKMSNLVMLDHITKGRLAPRFSEDADPQIVALARDCLLLHPKLRPSAQQVVERILKVCRS